MGLACASQKNLFLHHGPVGLLSFPWGHANPRTHQWNGAWSCGGYTSYLRDPPPPFFSTQRPMEVEGCTGLFRLAYWESDVQKFGYHALKLLPDYTSLMNVDIHLTPQVGQIATVFTSRDVFHQAIRAVVFLEAAGKRITSSYLDHLLKMAFQAPLFKKQLHFWKQSWARTEDKIQVVSDDAQKSFAEFLAIFREVATSDDATNRNNRRFEEPTPTSPIVAGRKLFGSIKEVIRLVMQELSIHPTFVFKLQSCPEASRIALHKRYFEDVCLRLQKRFREDFLGTMFTLSRGVYRDNPDVKSPSVSQSAYRDWIYWLPLELDKLGTLAFQAQHHIDAIIQTIGPVPQPAANQASGQTAGQANTSAINQANAPNPVSSQSSGLRQDIFKAIPKFSKRARDKRLERLVSATLSVVVPRKLEVLELFTLPTKHTDIPNQAIREISSIDDETTRTVIFNALQLLATLKETRRAANYVQEAAKRKQEARRIGAQLDAITAQLGTTF